MKRLFVWSLVLVFAMLLSSCGEASVTQNPEGGAQRYGTLKVVIPQDAPTLDPARITDNIGHEVGKQIFEGLVTYDKDLNIIPALAEKWEVSQDNLTYTFHLRDTKFSNGDQCTASDFKWSYERVLNPKTKSERTTFFDEIKGAKEYTAGQLAEVDGIKVIDEKTLAITLYEPSHLFLHKMTYATAYVVNKKIVESYQNNEEGADPNLKKGLWFELEPVGTGAFKLTSWTRESKLELVPNDLYWGEKASIEKLEFPVIKEDSVRMQEYQAGNIDVFYPIPDANFESVKNDPVLSKEIMQVKDLAIYYVGFVNKTPPFNNKKVRQAFNMAINRQDIIDKIFHGRHQLATGIIPNSMPQYSSLTDAYPFDPDQAKKLIEEAKKEGVVIPDKIIYAFNQGNVTHKNVAESIQAQIKGNLGVELQLEPVDWTPYLKGVDNGNYPLFRLGWVADYPDPDNFLWLLLDSSNAGPKGGGAFYNNPEFDKLVRDAKKEPDQAKRSEMYAKAEKIAMEDACWIPIAFQNSWLLVKPYISGYQRNPMGPLGYNTVKIASH